MTELSTLAPDTITARRIKLQAMFLAANAPVITGSYTWRIPYWSIVGVVCYNSYCREFNEERIPLPGPTVVFGFMLATLLGAAFHLVFGGDARRLALFLLAGWAGFGIGHVAGVLFGINLLNIGTLRVVSATFGAVLALGTTSMLTPKRPRKRQTR
jgi:hypothetical protein